MKKKAGYYLKLLTTNPFGVIRSILCKMRSLYYSSFIDEGLGKIPVSDPWLNIRIQKSKGAKLVISGEFRISPHLGGNSPVRIILERNSKLQVDGNFAIGQGVRIYLKEGAELFWEVRRSNLIQGLHLTH